MENDKHFVLTDKEYLFEQYSDSTIDIVADYEKKETLSAVMDIINTELSDEERKIILDSFFGEKDDVTLAREAGISPTLYNYRKSKALKKIKVIFDKNN